MLTGEYEILKMLYRLADEFKVHASEKRYAAAKAKYDAAVTMSVYLQVDIEHKIELFGNRPYSGDDEEIKDGLFPEKLVEYVYLQCIKSNQTREYERYPKKPA